MPWLIEARPGAARGPRRGPDDDDELDRRAADELGRAAADPLDHRGDGHPRRLPRRRDQPPAEPSSAPTIAGGTCSRGSGDALRATGLGAAELGLDRGRAGGGECRAAGAGADPGRAAVRRPSRDRPPPPAAPGTFGVRILAVSEVTRAIRGAVRADPRLSDLWVEGEIGRVTISSAGHAYFALKDERNQLQCVWFRDDRLRSAFQAQAGLRVVAHGRVDLFEPQGALQLYVESIQPAGLGDLTLRFEALKARLAAEGLFDAARKRPLPVRPATIAVITSPTGAVWRDICTRPRRGAGR